MWFWVAVVVLMIGAVTVLLVGSGSSLSDAYDDRPDQAIPVGRPLTADDLEDVRFTTAMRGYRMDEVDALLDRFRADLLTREISRPDASTAALAERRTEGSTVASGAELTGDTGVDSAQADGTTTDEASAAHALDSREDPASETTRSMPSVPPVSAAEIDADDPEDAGSRRDE